MDRNLVLLNPNIARLRRGVRLQSFEIEQLIAAPLSWEAELLRFLGRLPPNELALHPDLRCSPPSASGPATPVNLAA